MTDAQVSNLAPPAGLALIRLWYLLGALALLVVAALSLMPVPDIGVSDKLSHGLTYFLLAGWFSLLVVRPRALATIVAGLLCFGLLLELVQGMTGYRHAEWGDVVANGGGSLVGIWLHFSPLKRALGSVDASLLRRCRR